jgi:membrane-associated protein
MNEIIDFFKTLTNPQSIIEYGGIVLLLVVIFCENGVFFAFFFPGDSLVFTAGLFCAIGLLHYPLLTVELLMFTAAMLGYLFGYFFGYKSGELLMQRKDSIWFKKKYILMAQGYYDKYGGKMLIIARFLPIIRTFAPILSGILKMDLRKFMIFNAVGGFVWIFLFVHLGYYFGKMIPNPERYLHYIVFALVFGTSLPILLSLLRNKKNKTNNDNSQ